ncbi:General alpha-glucoside permease [Lecanosticta acicola]|uniref:General alpha-glucoside permease n=1 Tax=Lecanosticta acicola TaxID=111012 RepID=A0AAI9EAU7_9PEZI|nr:General alpha-glucoside permease [Lecanosticta acicola]
MAAAGPLSSWTGQPRIRGHSESMRLFLLTLSLIGLQFCWGTEQTYATPYLLALGLSKRKMSLVWLAGPLSGLIMQPIIGMISDKSTSRFGRRRPFMVGGTLAVAMCLLVLGWAKEIVGWWIPEQGERRREWTIALVVGDIYVLDFVINIAQATCRALVVDALPISQQQIGAAWVTRMVGVGHMLVFGFGAMDLSFVPSVFGDTQFKKVCSVAALVMVITQFTTCWAVTERVLVSDGSKPTGADQSLWTTIQQIYQRALYVPERIQAICTVQFWSWIGWFPLMFYGSTWVGEIYLRNEAPSAASDDALTEVGRIGSMGLIIHSTVGCFTAIVLPWLVTSPGEEEQPGYTPRPPEKLKSVVDFTKGITSRKPSLLNVWTMGCGIFAACMVFAPVVQSVRFAIFLMALTGVPSAIAGLAVGTFIGVEVNKLGGGGSSPLPLSSCGGGGGGHRFSDEYEMGGHNNNTNNTLHLRHSSTSSAGSSSTGELSGIYLGILNIYTTLPQFVGTGISWVVFSILEPGKSPELADEAHPDEHHSTEGVSGIGVCLFIGALCSVAAARATRRLR